CIARLLDRDARVGKRCFERRSVAGEDRRGLLDIFQDGGKALLILVVREFGEPLGQGRQALKELRRGVEDLAEAADPVRYHGLAGGSLVRDGRGALHRAVERNLGNAGETDTLERGGGPL